MHTIQEDMVELRRQLHKGFVQKAYRALLTYMSGLRTHYGNRYGDSAVSGLYQGCMDMTYFAVSPPFLKSRDLKVAVVFNYNRFRFEAWLAARNRKIQQQYWELFKDSHLAGCRVVSPAAGVDSIIECDLTDDFDLSDSDSLTSRIDHATTSFIDVIEKYLSGEHTG